MSDELANSQDMAFLIHEVFGFADHYAGLNLPTDVKAGLDGAFIDAVLVEAGKFAQQELAPLNASGDAQGCSYNPDDHTVAAPAGFKEAYTTYCAGGWAGLTGAPHLGGQGLPHSFGLFVQELTCNANMAWTMYPGLSHGAIAALAEHGSEEQQQTFLAPLLEGRWTGTMCLTEPHAGSDVGLAKTKALANADGTYAVTGTKIFISAGEHDLAENIVHLVLARTPDAPAGTKGISLFLVPKVDLDGTRNGVLCGGIEDKMGIHGNATCTLNFEQARGYLVGELNRGMRYMFTMMNAARLAVGLQGVSLAQVGLHRSMAYAQERLQMRSLTGPKEPAKAADPIIVHPDIRRLLLRQRAIVEGGRALVYHCAQLIDLNHAATDVAGRAAADQELDFLTPIVKGCLTEWGYQSVNDALQIFGGHGFIRENGVEQLVRDARITLLYEGTTGIQALDLLARKVLQTQGASLSKFIERVRTDAQAVQDMSCADLAAQLLDITDQWQALSMALGGRALQDLDEVGAAAVDYLHFSGHVVYAWVWLKLALVAEQKLDGDTQNLPPSAASKDFYTGKVAVARFYFARMLPQAQAHRQAIEAGGSSINRVTAVALAQI